MLDIQIKFITVLDKKMSIIACSDKKYIGTDRNDSPKKLAIEEGKVFRDKFFDKDI